MSGKSGAIRREVQELCDLHSALFHGATWEEQIANAKKEVMVSVKRAKKLATRKDYDFLYPLQKANCEI